MSTINPRSVFGAFTLLLMSACLLSPVPGFPQARTGNISGQVRSATGAPTVQMQIRLRLPNSGVVSTAKTDAAGLYRFSKLSPGTYEITASAPGFVTQVWTGVTVTPGGEHVLNIVMRPGNPGEVMKAAAPALAANQVLGSSGEKLNAATVRNTPLNGRDWTQLATLQAGVTGVQTGNATGVGNTDRSFGAAVSVSGARPDQNSYRLDGISINDYSNGAPGSVLGDNLGIDAVEQVSVLGNNYPAEYGRTSGGVINAVTRSGANAFHGDLYEFLRNSVLDARNYFDGRIIPPFKRNQFGGSGGLPIKKGRTFIFGDYEGLRQSLGVTTVDTVPSANARLGIVHDASGNLLGPNGSPASGPWTGPCPLANQTNLAPGQAGFCVDNYIAADNPQHSSFVNAFFPKPNGQLIGNGDTGIFSFAAQEITTENYFTIRFDHKFTDSDSFYATYIRDNSTTVQPGTFGELSSDIVSNRQAATIHEQHIFSANLLNDGHIGFSRAIGIIGKVNQVLNPLMNDAYYAFEPGGFAGDIQSIPGVTSFLGAPTAEGFIPSSRTLAWTSYQGGDDLVLTNGRHSIKFGAEVERMQDNEISASNINGLFRFDSLTQFLTNEPSLFSGTGTPLPLDIGLQIG